MNKIITYKLPIYRVCIWVTNSTDVEYLKRTFWSPDKDNFTSNIGEDKWAANVTHILIHNKTNLYGILIYGKEVENLDSSLIAHEAYHIAHEILLHIGEDNPGEECMAYLIEYCYKCINAAIKDIKKLMK